MTLAPFRVVRGVIRRDANMTAGQFFVIAVICGIFWLVTRGLNPDDKFMAILWFLAVGGLIYMIGPENVSVGFPQGD